jgi:hypothetical protein
VTGRGTAAALAGGLVLAVLTATPAAAASDGTDAVRAATAGFHDVGAALDADFVELQDQDGIACIDNPAGGMGIHSVNGDRVGDPAEDAASPELLVYEPQKNGRLRLVAVEYVVLAEAWDADNEDPPSLFGQEFELVHAGNRYGLPDFYELHAWVWKHNPAGMFEDWNPNVSCP